MCSKKGTVTMEHAGLDWKHELGKGTEFMGVERRLVAPGGTSTMT